MNKWLLLLLMLLFIGSSIVRAEDAGEKEPSWWQQRHDRPDIFYPHQLHFKAMQQEGDPCLLCHSFARNDEPKVDQLKALTTIANEPLEAICHSCHVDRNSAPFKCDLCHTDPTAIWPRSHDNDYVNHHAEDGRLDEGECQSCHLDVSFCSDCHFHRDSSNHQQHELGYLQLHGIDARMNTLSCARCHSSRYCADCHRGIR